MPSRVKYPVIAGIVVVFAGALVIGNYSSRYVRHDLAEGFQNHSFSLSDDQVLATGTVTLTDTRCTSPLRVVSYTDQAAFTDASHSLGREVDAKTGSFPYAKPKYTADTYLVYEYRGQPFDFQNKTHICLMGTSIANVDSFSIDANSSVASALGTYTTERIMKLQSYAAVSQLITSQLKTTYLDEILNSDDFKSKFAALRKEAATLPKPTPPTPSPTP